MPDVLITLGGNQGNVADTFRRVLDVLDEMPDVRIAAVSPFASTTAVELAGSASPTYLNAAARLETTLTPPRLLKALQTIELRLGRQTGERWGGRPIDLDIAWFGDLVLNSPTLIVPHPAAWYRRFVLDPTVEIAPDFVDPVKQKTLAELRQRLLPRPLTIGLAGDSAAMESLAQRFRYSPALVRLMTWSPGDAEPTFLVWCGPADHSDRHALPHLPLISRPWPVEASPAEFLNILAASAVGPDMG
jgi:2-amino-4-hydroxy-6-hydroxymethyldihydropteridine diphosphokinase